MQNREEPSQMVLDVVEDRFDANYGVTWEHIEEAIIYVVEQDRI